MSVEAAGAYLKRLRKASDLTLQEIADAAGTSISQISRIETGDGNTRGQLLLHYTRIVDGDTDEVTNLLLDPDATVEQGKALAERRLRRGFTPEERGERSPEDDPETDALLDEIEQELKFSNQAKVVLRALLDAWREGREGREGKRRTSEG